MRTVRAPPVFDRRCRLDVPDGVRDARGRDPRAPVPGETVLRLGRAPP